MVKMTGNVNNYREGVYCHLKQTVHVLKHHNKGKKARLLAEMLEKHLDEEEDGG